MFIAQTLGLSMAFKKIINLLILIPLIVNLGEAKIKHKVLATNQSPGKIRFMSNDGKFVYYQKKSGELLLSSDFKISTMRSTVLSTGPSMTSVFLEVFGT